MTIENFSRGESAQLNMFLSIWNIPTLQTAIDEPERPIFTLNDAGLIEKEMTPAKWSRGSMREGAFTFLLDAQEYTAVYRDYRILELWQNGALLKTTDPAGPTVRLEFHRSAAVLLLKLRGLELGTRCTIEVSQDLIHWTELEPKLGATEELELQIKDLGQFFRARMQAQPSTITPPSL